MVANKSWLEKRITELNDWIQEHTKTHPEYNLKVHDRNYYVNKIIELEENNLKHIKI